jgi:hypothetical protein
MHTKFFVGKREGKRYLEALDIDWRIRVIKSRRMD